MAISRRSFLGAVCAGTCGSAIHGSLCFTSRYSAYALPTSQPFVGGSPVFILLNLAGGCSYNITPIYHGIWRDRNPTISYGPENSFPIAPDQGLHPSLTYLHQLYNQGELVVLNNVGLPMQSRSHDDATNQIFVASSSFSPSKAGWAALLTSQASSFFSGISLAGTNALVRGGTNPPRAVSDLANFGENRFVYNDRATKWLQNTRTNIIASSTTKETASKKLVRDAMINVETSAKLIAEQTSNPLPPIDNPFPNTSFGRSCQDMAKLIAAPALGTLFFYLERGGFDTHSNEFTNQAALLNDVNAGLRSLIQTLKAFGIWGRVVIATMSEFCRTFENASFGTDHGYTAPLLVMGGNVAGRQLNPAPSPAEIQAANSYLQALHIDFRSVYWEIVQRMGLDPGAVFQEPFGFTPLGLFRS